jgi:hypothetical protein
MDVFSGSFVPYHLEIGRSQIMEKIMEFFPTLPDDGKISIE